MREHTHREYLAWLQWLENDYDIPSRADHYAMQIAQEIRRVAPSMFGGKPNDIKRGHFYIQHNKPEERELTEAEKKSYLLQSKMRWFGALKIPMKKS